MGESCCSSRARARSRTPPTRASRSGSSTARRRTRSCSATSAGSTEHEGFPGHPLTPLPELVDLHERLSLRARPATVAAIALNTRGLDEDAARAAIAGGRRRDRPPGRRSGALRAGSAAGRGARRLALTRTRVRSTLANTCSFGSQSSSSSPPSRSPSPPASRAARRPPSGTSCIRATRCGASRRRTTPAIRATAIGKIEQRNQLAGPSIQPGQRLVLPSG